MSPYSLSICAIRSVRILALLAASFSGAVHLQAAISTSGDVAPAIPPNGVLGSTALVVGDTTLAALYVDDDSDLVCGQTTLARTASSIAAAHVSGNGSTWQIDSYFHIGESGDAALIIEGGGSVQAQSALIGVNSTSTSQLNVDGAGSRFSTTSSANIAFWVDNGIFNVTGGGMADTGSTWLRNHLAGQGAALVDGAGSRWQAETIVIADRGSLRVRNGGVVEAGSIVSGINDTFTADGNFDANTLIEVDGPGSRLVGNVIVANYSIYSRPDSSRSELIVRNGAFFDGSLSAGLDEHVAAYVTIENVGTTWNYGSAQIGDRGPTRFTLRDGAKANGGWVTIAGGTGAPLSAQAIVEGAGTEWHIGAAPGGTQGLLLGAYTANGSLDIRDHAMVTAARTEIGFVGNQVNRVTASGPGTKFDHGWMDVGTYGRGLLEVRGGANVSGTFARLGVDYAGRGEVLVDGPGSTWTLDDLQLSYGLQNFATIHLRGGGKLLAKNVWLSGSNSTNLIDVDGPNTSFEVTGILRQGYFTSGQSTIQFRHGAQGKIHTAFVGDGGSKPNLVELRDDGTALEIADHLVLGRDAADSFTPLDTLAAYAGANVHIGRSLHLGANGRFTLNGGKATVGELLETPSMSSLFISPDGLVTGVGVIEGHVLNGGIVAPGSSPGQLSVSGDFSQVSVGTLQIEIAGATPELYDRLQVGAAQLHGTLEVSLLDDYIPEIGAEFTILESFRPIAGNFRHFVLPHLPSDRFWKASVEQHQVKLTIEQVPEPAALATVFGLITVLSCCPALGKTRQLHRIHSADRLGD